MQRFEGNSIIERPRIARVRPQALVIAAALVVVAVFSATVLAGFFSSTETYRGAFQKLDDKRNTVLALTAASATASAALTLIPEDTCTPIAEQLSEISKDFTFVIAALLLEKYLLTIIGFVFFGVVVPVCCLLFAFAQFMDREHPSRRMMQTGALRLLAFGFVLFIATPSSVFITSKIDETYQESIDATVQNAQQVTEALEVAANNTERQDPENPLEYLQQRLEDLQLVADKAVAGATGAIEWVKGLLGSFVEAFAVMIVTSVIFPILVPLLIYLAFKVLLDQQVVVVQPNQSSHRPAHYCIDETNSHILARKD